jgi:diguanylate cyclase
MTTEFLIGVVVTAILITLGLVLGYWVGRRYDASKTTDSLRDMEPLLANLRRFTNNFSQDVSAYRSVINTASEQARELALLPNTPGAAPNTSALLLTQIMEANELLQQRLSDAETNLHAQSQKLHTYMTEARTDLLTGISNRRAFDEELNKRHAMFQRQRVPLGVLLIDVDHFKSVNDRYGHAVGDIVLKRVAEALDRAARDTDVVARYGGEEFVVAMVGSSAEEFSKAADRLRRAVQSIEVRSDNLSIKPTVSCGVAEIQEGEKVTDLVRRADEALYTAKREGRNCAFYHDGKRSFRVQIQQPTTTHSHTDAVVPQSELFLQLCTDLRKKLTQLKR